MLISSHIGTIILGIVGAVSVIGIIIISALETMRKDKGLPPILRHTEEIPADKKKN